MPPTLRRLARRQAGAFTRRQARQCGVTDAEVQARLLDGTWVLVMADVLIGAGTPVTTELKAWTGVLAMSQPVALAARTAGVHLGLERVPDPPRPQFVVPSGRRFAHLPGLEVRRANSWHVTWHAGLPVTPVPVTIRDLAGDVPRDRLRDVVQHALRRRRTSWRALEATLGRGLGGSAALRDVLAEVAPGYQVKWERTLHRAVARRGLVLRPQVPVRGPDGTIVACLDLGDERLRFGVEVDGFVNHMARFVADRRRARKVAFDYGWLVAVYAVEEVADHLDEVADEVVRYGDQRRRALAS